jgi:hypothetical protein
LNDPDSAILYCNVYRDGVLFQTMNNCPNGLNQSSLMSPSYGIHTLQVEAVDMWDNETLSPLIQFEVIPERPINNYDDKLDSYAYSGIILPVHLGGCYVVGGVTTAANGQHDTVVHRYDRNLNLIWRQPISGPIGINQTAVRAKLTPDGGLVTIGTGNVRVPWSSDLIATRFAPDGTKLWQYIYDGTPPGYPIYLNDTGKDIAVDAEGNAYLLGSTRPYGNPLDDYLVITKLSPNGTVVWSRYFGVENGLQEISAAIAVGASGLLYVASQSKLSTEWRAGTIYLYALAPSGDLLSTGKFTGPSFADQPAALAVEGDGSVYVTANIGYSATDVFMTTIKFDSFGHVDWWLPVSGGTLPNSYRKLIQIGASGCLYELGTLDDGGANTERYIIHKITPTGELVWSRSSSLTSVSATAMVLDAHENIYLVGSWFNQGVGTFGLFAKYDKDGNELYSDLCGGASGTYCLWNDVALSDTDGVYVVGGGSGIIVATTYLANGSMVYGHTELGAFAGEFGGVPFGVYIQGRQYQAATNISPLGNYWLVVPTPDPVELIVKPSHWLSVKQPFEPTTTATRLDWTFPVNGDVAQNNRIDLADLNAIFLDYGGTSSSADADGDGVVDLKDLNLIFVSFGLSGQE